MLKSHDYSLLGVIAEKRQGISCSKQFVNCLSYLGTIEKISSIYQFTPDELKGEIKNTTLFTHLCFSLILRLKESESEGVDFAKQIEGFAENSARSTTSKSFKVKILDFRSEFSMSRDLTTPYPKWLEKPELLFPSLEILPIEYVHPVLNQPLNTKVLSSSVWDRSEFLQTGKSLLTK